MLHLPNVMHLATDVAGVTHDSADSTSLDLAAALHPSAAVGGTPTVAAKALNGRAASSRKRHFDPQSARYDFRVFLLHLGLIGDEFKTARKHLLAALPGDSAFKRGRPKPKQQTAAEAESSTEAGPQTRPPAFSGDEPAVTEDGGES